MASTMISNGVWKEITRAARAGKRAYVAVAYLGKGAGRLLPLGPGSQLVVDASDAAVKHGQTCPAELNALRKGGVSIYSVANLHAKVFVFGKQAFVGSANASNHSANALVEAVVRCTDAKVVKAARAFVQSLCGDELGPAEIKRLAKLYRPPKFLGGTGDGPGNGPKMPRLFLAQLVPADLPKGSEAASAKGEKEAKRKLKHRKTHLADDFWRRGDCPFGLGSQVVQVVDEGKGRVMVSAPGKVIHRRKWSNGRRRITFVYLEVARRQRISLGRLARMVGRGSKKRLLRDGAVANGPLAQALRGAWASS